MNSKLAGLVSVATVSLVLAQTNPGIRPEFAVASIRPNDSLCADSATSSCTAYGVGNGKGYGKYATLKMLVALAYRVQQFQISGGPAWIGSDRFDVEGKSEDPNADFAQLRLMLQSLLEDRFQLKLHRETRKSAVYALVVAKGGTKIRLSSDQTSPDAVGGPTSPEDGPSHGGVLMGPGMLIANAVPLSRFVAVLAPQLDRPVINRTNLGGRFDIRLHWTPDRLESRDDPGGTTLPAVASSDAPSIFTATQEQLGLKLESASGPAEVLVVDRVAKPSAN